MAASNYVYSYGHQLVRMNGEKLSKDFDHLVSPDAINKFRHAILDLKHPDPVHHLVSSLMVKLLDCHDIEPVILYRQKQPLQKVPFKIEPLPPNHQSTLQLDIAEFAKAELAKVDAQNHQPIQFRLIFKVRREEQEKEARYNNNNEQEELECAICINKLNKDDNNIKLTPCQHAFHEDCYFKWWKRSRSCPMCRSTLPITYLC